VYVSLSCGVKIAYLISGVIQFVICEFYWYGYAIRVQQCLFKRCQLLCPIWTVFVVVL
jgi:hypothetical protein